MNIPRMELTAATGVTGFAVVQLFAMYRETAPKLTDVRYAPEGDHTARQMVLDADILVGGLSILVGVSAAVLSRSWLPALLMFAGFTLISLYYHAVCNSPSPTEV